MKQNIIDIRYFLQYFKYNSFNSLTNVLSNEQLSFSSDTNNIISKVIRIEMYNFHTGSSTGTKLPMHNSKYLISTRFIIFRAKIKTAHSIVKDLKGKKF